MYYRYCFSQMVRLSTLFAFLLCAVLSWIPEGQALTKSECDRIQVAEFAAGWAPAENVPGRYEGFEARVELPRLSAFPPVDDGWMMEVHSDAMLGFRSRADMEAARGRMGIVLHALEGLLLGLEPRAFCSLEERAKLSDIRERVVEAILHPIAVRIVAHGGVYKWVKAE